MHLANYSINKYSKDFIDDLTVDDILKPNGATKRTLNALFAQIEEEWGDPQIVEKLKKDIHKLC